MKPNAEYLAALEALRREPPDPHLSPGSAVPLPGGALLDYAGAALKVDLAVHHLDEALPTAQRRRAVLAYTVLRLGVEELHAWMLMRGYFNDV